MEFTIFSHGIFTKKNRLYLYKIDLVTDRVTGGVFSRLQNHLCW